MAKLVIAVIAFAVLGSFDIRELWVPRYDGQTLTHWVNQLGSSDEWHRKEAEVALRAIGEPAVISLTGMLQEKSDLRRFLIGVAALLKLPIDIDWEWAYRKQFAASRALYALGEAAAKSAPILIQLRAGRDKELASFAGFALQNVGLAAVPAIPLLLQDLRTLQPHRLTDSQETAINTLVGIGNSVVPHLLLELENSEPHMQLAILDMLGKIRGARVLSLDAVISLMENSDASVVERAVEILSLYGQESRAAVPRLEELILSTNFSLKLKAIVTLDSIASNEWIFSRRLLDLMSDARKHRHFEVALRVAGILAERGDLDAKATVFPFLMSQLKTDWPRRAEACRHLVHYGDEAAPAISVIIPGLTNHYAFVRNPTIDLLGAIGTDLAVAELYRALGNSHPNAPLEAAVMLVRIGRVDSVVIDVLASAIRSEDKWERLEAAEALSLVGSLRTKDLLQSLSQDEYRRLRDFSSVGVSR